MEIHMPEADILATIHLPLLKVSNAEQSVEIEQLSLVAGQIVFVLGANGTGKSSLLTNIFQHCGKQVRRIAAHRHTSFQSGEISITAQQRRQNIKIFQQVNAASKSRWFDDYAESRATSALFDLVSSESLRSQKIANAVDAGDLIAAQVEANKKEAALVILNRLLKAASIDIEIVLKGAEEILARRTGMPDYGVNQMSDGQRSALLLASEVLTAPEGTIFLIDEPERHLHRAISSPLLRDLFAQRPDCVFVVSTHEIYLASEHSKAIMVLVRSYYPHGLANPTLQECWDFDIYAPTDDSGAARDDLRRDILGARRRILFVEGKPDSLDQPLYSLLFPSVSVRAKNTCTDVERAVIGLRSSQELHWMQVYGIVDGDGRAPEDIDRLRENGVFVLPTNAVESLYYHPDVIRTVAQNLSSAMGVDAETTIESAYTNMRRQFQNERAELCAAAVEHTAREMARRHLPTRSDINRRSWEPPQIDLSSLLEVTESHYDQLLADNQLASLVMEFKVRRAGIPKAVADAFGNKNSSVYELYVRTQMQKDPSLLSFMRGLVQPLSSKLLATT
jgi:ABC-type cobalamin/Fe3+-siderophores transport system ATPase subunit